MNKQLITIETLLETVNSFYTPQTYFLNTIIALDNGETVEIQWIFSARNELCETKVLYAFVPYDATIPSIATLVKNSTIFESEIAELFGLNIENAKMGIFLEPHAPKAPLRRVK